MKRNLIYAAALSLAVFCLAGCNQTAPEDKEEMTVSPGDLEIVEPAPVEENPAPVKEPEVEVEEPAEPVHEFRPGIWLGKNDVGYTAYYEFLPEQSLAASCNLDYGIIQGYEYEGSGDEVTFTLTSYTSHGGQHQDVLEHTPSEMLPPADSSFPATVEEVSKDEFILHWDHALPETLTFVQDGDVRLEDFPFHCNAALAEMALDYYAAHSGVSAEEIAEMNLGVMTNVDNTVTIQLYHNLGDHNSNAAWYIVDRFTAAGTDLTSGAEINLLEDETETTEPEQNIEPELPEEPIVDEEIPSEEEIPETVPGEIYAEQN